MPARKRLPPGRSFFARGAKKGRRTSHKQLCGGQDGGEVTGGIHQGGAADLGGLVVAGQGAGGDGTVLHRQGGGDVAAKALGRAGQGLGAGRGGRRRAAAAGGKGGGAQRAAQSDGKDAFHMFEPRFCRTMPPGLPGRAWGAPESPVQTHL